MKYSLIILSFICLLFVSQKSNALVPEGVDSLDTMDSTQISQDSLFANINKNFEKVKPILEYSCYDCHSANTKEPWYFNIPGVHSLIASHIKEGREHLDFTNGFPFKSKESTLGILHEIKQEVEEGEMPIFSYRMMHWGRLIEDEKQDSLFQWIDSTIVLLKEFEKNKK